MTTIKTSDLRKGNIINTEYGICRVHAIVWNSIEVIGKDGRKLWANQIEGVELTDEMLLKCGFLKDDLNKWFVQEKYVNQCRIKLQKYKNDVFQWAPSNWIAVSLPYVHDLQNLFKILNKEELEITL